jgi:hypothetical protein
MLLGAKAWFLKPGEELDDAITITLDDKWAVPKEGNDPSFGRAGIGKYWGERLKLTPGSHTIRVRFSHDPGPFPEQHQKRSVSNPVEIEIHPAAQQGGVEPKEMEVPRVF